jgi:hypothetical protein
MVIFTPRLLYPRRQTPPYPFNTRLCGLQSRSRRLEKTSLPLPGTEPLYVLRPVDSLASISTTLGFFKWKTTYVEGVKLSFHRKHFKLNSDILQIPGHVFLPLPSKTSTSKLRLTSFYRPWKTLSLTLAKQQLQ